MLGEPQNYLAVIKVDRRRRRRVQRRQPDDRRRAEGRRVHRGEHRRAVAADERRRREARHRARRSPAGSAPAPTPRSVGRPPRTTATRSKRCCKRRRHGVHHRSARAVAPAPAVRRSSPRSRRPPARSRSGSSPGRSASRAVAASVQAENGIQKLQREGRHAHRHPERPAAQRVRRAHVDAERVQDGRRGAAPGRAGHHRPHHDAGPHQHRLRRRADDHEQRRHRAAWASATPRATAVPSTPPAPRSRARCSKRASRVPAACC